MTQWLSSRALGLNERRNQCAVASANLGMWAANQLGSPAKPSYDGKACRCRVMFRMAVEEPSEARFVKVSGCVNGLSARADRHRMRLTTTKKVSAFIQLVNAFWFSFARRNMIVL